MDKDIAELRKEAIKGVSALLKYINAEGCANPEVIGALGIIYGWMFLDE